VAAIWKVERLQAVLNCRTAVCGSLRQLTSFAKIERPRAADHRPTPVANSVKPRPRRERLLPVQACRWIGTTDMCILPRRDVT
jgi:hypothetical protein